MSVIQDYPALDAWLASRHCLRVPAEVDGVLCGLACGLGEEPEKLLQEAQSYLQLAQTSETRDVLKAWFQLTLSRLRADDHGFAPLLPDDEEQPSQRAQALVGWCAAFLHGVTLSVRDQDQLEPEVLEMLQDLSDIADAELDDEEDDALETALIELYEYVRIGAQTLYWDCQSRQAERRATGESHVH